MLAVVQNLSARALYENPRITWRTAKLRCLTIRKRALHCLRQAIRPTQYHGTGTIAVDLAFAALNAAWTALLGPRKYLQGRTNARAARRFECLVVHQYQPGG